MSARGEGTYQSEEQTSRGWALGDPIQKLFLRGVFDAGESLREFDKTREMARGGGVDNCFRGWVVLNSVQTRCIVKGEAQKSPLFWRFSGGF